MWTSLFSAALAADCEPLDEAEFRSYVLDAQSAIDRGDVDLPASILAELDHRIPCLTFPPQPRMWADLLVARAIVEFSRGGPWEQAMAAALRIRPAIDRGVGSSHPLATWEPGPAPASGPPVPAGQKLYVDGAVAVVAPPDEGLHLVQKTDGRFWNTLLLLDEPLPEGWLEAPVDQPPRVASWGRAAVVLGGGSVVQQTNWGSDWYVGVGADTTGATMLGVAGDLHVTFWSPFGLLAQGGVRFMPLSPGLDGRVSAIWAWRGLTVGGGIGASSVDTYESVDGELVHRWRMLRYPEGTVLLRSRKGFRWDLGATGGASGPLRALDVGAGFLLGEHVRIGLESSVRDGRFQQEGARDRELATVSTRFGLRLDLVRGEY